MCFLASVTEDGLLIVNHGGEKAKRADFIEESDFVLFLLVAPGPDPVADVPWRLRLGHGVEGCRRSAELVLEINLKVGGGMEVRVTVRLGSLEGQCVQPPQGAGKSGHCLPSHRVTEVSHLRKQQLGN